MRILKSFCIAFSMYSKIPMPQFKWTEEDMRYSLCFFPWVGAVIAGLLYLFGKACENFSVNPVFFLMISAAIPLLVTGGIHVDGYMDTMDALHSYQPKEEKLRILKDPHIGAFSVIMLLLYYLVYLGFFSEVKDKSTFLIVILGFAISRTLGGLAVVHFEPAKKDGLLRAFKDPVRKKTVSFTLILQLALALIAGCLVNPRKMILTALGAVSFMFYYKNRCKREFGGITGDTSGWFIQILELVILVIAVIDGLF